MHRTTVMLPSSLKTRAQAYASKIGISVGELIRESLEATLHHAKGLQKSDPFFDDIHFFDGDIPSDLSSNLDEYLYGDIR
jgi:hypothetical protein